MPVVHASAVPRPAVNFDPFPPEKIIHRPAPGEKTTSRYTDRVHCRKRPRFEGGYTEGMWVSHDPSEVTCSECRQTRLGAVLEYVGLFALIVAVVVVGTAEMVYVRLQAPPQRQERGDMNGPRCNPVGHALGH